MGTEARVADGTVVAGKYRIRRVVGTGSMGVVCEAEHIEIGKRVALKLVEGSLAGARDIVLRFRQEARAASRVESSHIVQVFDVGTDSDLGLYMVMEFLTGEDLQHVLAREKRLASERAVRIAVQVARGLSKAHEAGVVHRDLKPANIFLCSRDDGEQAKILDFGISKIRDAARGEAALPLTRAGTVVGTPQYMSPEQAQGFSVDERTDVWSLGLVLYEMVAGRPAYPELPTYEQFIVNLVTRPPDRLADVAPWVPEPIAEVVHQAIEHDLAKRIGSCAEMASKLLAAHSVRDQRLSWSGPMPPETDTWDDSGPSADEVIRALAKTDEREPAPPSRTLVMDEPGGIDDSIDVEITVEPPVVVEKPREPTIASSGVRPMVEDVHAPVEMAEEDAPQFFDRKALVRSLEAASTSSPPSSGAPAVSTSGGTTAATAAQAAQPLATGRARLAWALVLLAVLAAGIVAAIALR